MFVTNYWHRLYVILKKVTARYTSTIDYHFNSNHFKMAATAN